MIRKYTIVEVPGSHYEDEDPDGEWCRWEDVSKLADIVEAARRYKTAYKKTHVPFIESEVKARNALFKVLE